MNMTCGFGCYQGGELWLQVPPDDPGEGHPLHWQTLPHGPRVPGVYRDLRMKPLIFDPKRYHSVRAWTGDRFSVTAHTARTLDRADPDLRHRLKQVGFAVPSKPSIVKEETAWDAVETVEAEDNPNEEVLTLEEQEDILLTLHEVEEEVEAILGVYPKGSRLEVLQVCSSWAHDDKIHNYLDQAGWNVEVAGLNNGCDLVSKKGLERTLQMVQQRRPQWLWCCVPPSVLKTLDLEVSGDKVQRGKRLLRNLMKVSLQQLQQGGDVLWVSNSCDPVCFPREVREFWRVHGHGPPRRLGPQTMVYSNNKAVMNSVNENLEDDEDIWKEIIFRTVQARPVVWTSTNHSVYAVDLECLNTLTTQELAKATEHVRRLHRRFGHPSNHLLVKNLQARNADPRLVAIASQLQCDECQESKIKLPGPIVNLDKEERLWACVQVDAFYLRVGDQVHHFLLMVDEASSYAVIRELFHHHETGSRNMTGEEAVKAIMEGWIQYFGFPDTLKCDLEGALRSHELNNLCAENGVELIPAPAEHHDSIAEVERSIGVLRHRVETFLRGNPGPPGQAALAMVTAHNSMARVHGYSPLQWALGREWTPGRRLFEGAHEVPTEESKATPGTRWHDIHNLRLAAEKGFLEYKAKAQASRAMNSKVRKVTQYLPGDLIYYRRVQHPSDRPSNNLVDRPRLTTARWFGPGRILACETKKEQGHRKPSSYLWAICNGRLKKFHVNQVRHCSEAERLIAESTDVVTMPWTLSSLTSLLNKGAYDDETRPRKRYGIASVPHKLRRRQTRASLEPRQAQHPAQRRPDTATFDSEEEMIPDAKMKRAREGDRDGREDPLEAPEIDVDRLLNDPRYWPEALPDRGAGTDFRAQRARHEQEDRPWHVQNAANVNLAVEDSETIQEIFSVIVDVPADDIGWRKIIKDPSKFLSKQVHKGVEVSWARLSPTQRAAMQEAKQAEVKSWIANDVVRKAIPGISPDQALKMRWALTFKTAKDEMPNKMKAKARLVLLGYSDPNLLENPTSSPAMSRLSRQLVLNLGVQKGWRIMSGDVRTAFLQAKSPERVSPLFARPVEELAVEMGLAPEDMVEVMKSAYGLTTAPREWYVDFDSTVRDLGARRCQTDPCVWVISENMMLSLEFWERMWMTCFSLETNRVPHG